MYIVHFKLNSYVVSDIMESGLTLNQDSFVVTLEDIDGNTLTTLENTTSKDFRLKSYTISSYTRR